jgi:hypothetical protein
LSYTFKFKVIDGNKQKIKGIKDRVLLYVAFIITPEVMNQGFLSVIQHSSAIPNKSTFRINIKKNKHNAKT